jgi:polyisoprenoid-binding protein YceI
MICQIDPVHSRVGFSVRHMMVTTVRGVFSKFQGTIDLDQADFTRSTLEGRIETDSIDTGNADRDNHLRTTDFFDAKTSPTMTFKSTSIEKKGDDYVVHGHLTLRGVTKPITLQAEYAGTAKNPYGEMIIGVSASGSISRKEFGLVWNAALETGGVAVSDTVKLELDVQAKLPK